MGLPRTDNLCENGCIKSPRCSFVVAGPPIALECPAFDHDPFLYTFDDFQQSLVSRESSCHAIVHEYQSSQSSKIEMIEMMQVLKDVRLHAIVL